MRITPISYEHLQELKKFAPKGIKVMEANGNYYLIER
jgi:hypothetical protein